MPLAGTVVGHIIHSRLQYTVCASGTNPFQLKCGSIPIPSPTWNILTVVLVVSAAWIDCIDRSSVHWSPT
eukprot:scaffold44830_cov34-Attheya_sp.AAC.1